MNSLFIAQPPGRTTDKSLICSCGWHRVTNVLPMSVRFHRWTLGFRQSSFNHIAQALQSHNLHVFHYSPLHIHALVPFLFRVQVSCSPRRHCPERRPPLVAILLVRTTAHPFNAIGSSISKALLDRETRMSVTAHTSRYTCRAVARCGNGVGAPANDTTALRTVAAICFPT